MAFPLLVYSMLKQIELIYIKINVQSELSIINTREIKLKDYKMKDHHYRKLSLP